MIVRKSRLLILCILMLSVVVSCQPTAAAQTAEKPVVPKPLIRAGPGVDAKCTITYPVENDELRAAADKLIERIEHPRTALPEHIVVQGRLLEGGTVKQLN